MRSRRLALGVVALAFVAFGFELARRVRADWPFTIDDAYITMRYAKHLADGLGPTWNPGRAPAEGYTSAAWMAVLALFCLVGFRTIALAKVLGVVFGALSVIAAAALSVRVVRDERPFVRASAAAFACLAMAAYWPLALHAVSGMETTLAALLLTSFFLAIVRFEDAPSIGGARAIAVLGFASTLARPEAALACGVALVALACVVAPDARRTCAREIVRFAVVPGLAYFALRYAYFGRPFPLPFYVKALGQTRFAGLDDVLDFARGFTWDRPAFALLVAIGLFAHRRRVTPIALAAAALAIFFVFPSHIQGYLGRFLFPIVPLLAALAGAGFGACVGALESRLDAVRAATRGPLHVLSRAGVLLALVLVAMRPFPRGEDSETRQWVAYGRGLERAHVRLGETLRELTTEAHAPVIALLDVGAVAYESEWETIDTFGLNDPHVADTHRADVAYLFANDPEVVVVVSRESDRYVPFFDWEVPIRRAALDRGFAFVRTYRFLDDYHLHVLVRPGSSLEAPLRAESASR